eukprot:75228_1
MVNENHHFSYFYRHGGVQKKNKVKSLEWDSNNNLQRRFTLEDSDNFESVGDKYKDIPPSLAIRGLTKHFSSVLGGKVVRAVNSISMDVYSGEVFCLLGHNGAGKTTTINMLTGLLDTTEGDAWILGNSIHDGMRAIRKTLGVCPQHDVLFKRLTAREHLELFCRLKGVPSRLIKGEVDKTLDEVGLRDKENEFPPCMSGGQKRKLSLGIALIGGSKVVFLDEPTSGMDPQSRRVTWELIAREKKNRCIILTTHFMDEADILADRIAIMSTGHIRCCGSALFLKRLYGVGYTFTISLNIGVDPKAIKHEIDNVVLKSIEGASVVAVAGGEIAYRLPFEETSDFPDVFETLDKEKNNLSISTYGISVTTLEEVFLKIGEEHREEIEGPDESDSTDSDLFGDFEDDDLGSVKSIKLQKSNPSNKYVEINEDDEKQISTTTIGLLPEEQAKINKNIAKHKHDYEQVGHVFPQPTFQLQEQSEFVIFFEHFFAILYRRWFWGIRDFRALCCQVLLPGYFATVGLAILKLTTSINNPSLELANQFYGSQAGINGYVVPYTQVDGYDINKQFGANSSEIETYEDYFEDSWGNFTEVQLSEDSLYDVRDFQTWLLDQYNADGKWHYNAFWTANGAKYTIPDVTLPPNVTLPPTLPPIVAPGNHTVNLTNTIQLGINCTAVHSLPIVYNQIDNLLLKNRINPDASITLYTHP